MGKPFVIRSAEQLEVIASPGREDIVDAVALIGPCRISQLARALRRSRHSLYYHVRALRDCGLLVEARRTGEGARPTAYYDTPGRPFSVSFDISAESRRQAVLSLAASRMRTAVRGFERACQPGIATVEGPRRDLWATHLKGWLSESEVEEANRLLGRLIELVGALAAGEVSGKKPYEFSFVLCPCIS
jgi:DNA-binding transcriptional ArsR family regulator